MVSAMKGVTKKARASSGMNKKSLKSAMKQARAGMKKKKPMKSVMKSNKSKTTLTQKINSLGRKINLVARNQSRLIHVNDSFHQAIAHEVMMINKSIYPPHLVHQGVLDMSDNGHARALQGD